MILQAAQVTIGVLLGLLVVVAVLAALGAVGRWLAYTRPVWWLRARLAARRLRRS